MSAGRVGLNFDVSAGGRVAHLLLDRPEKRNALTPEMIAELTGHATALAGDEALRAVVISGAGGTFSAGANLDTLAGLTEAPEAEAFISSLHKAIDAVRRLPVPVIARLSGPCFGGALELAAACDLRAGDASLTLSMPEVRVGVPSVIEAALLPRLIGWGAASELVLTGAVRDADWARASGFVQSLDGDAAVTAWLTDILASGPIAVRAQKRVMRLWETAADGGVSGSIPIFAETCATGEATAMIAALKSARRKDKA